MYELEKVMSKFHPNNKWRIRYEESLWAFAKTLANKLYEKNLSLEDNDFSFAKQCVSFAIKAKERYSEKTLHIISVCFDDVFDGLEVKQYIKRIEALNSVLVKH